MAEERLSRLQKWILKALYLIGPEGKVSVRDLKETSIRGLVEIWGKSETLESPWGKKGIKLASLDDSFSRTLRNLIRKGLLDDYPTDLMKEVRGINVFGSVCNLGAVALTDEGKAKAKELLNVK